MFVFVTSFLMYLLLVWSGGTINVVEIGIALILATILAFASHTWNPSKPFSFRALNPLRWITFVYYVCVPFAIGLIKANFDVAMRVITGHINPGIVKLEPGLKSDLAKTILADSITLTPGTLTVDVDDDGAFYIHWINVLDVSPDEKQVYGSFAHWARRLAD
ncbi:MAG: Na+/H+ antiporter subunit E [Aminobacterium sp.]|nr:MULTISPECIES: Na+/H+ antiporter subunit E [unclassified Aminobacterium]MDD2206814.1 Na+/H+ antiporter subunit E [Aminobacterium sp.]MDD3426135.1 Na+/H+ antiporter subunit E [Aminobacterium sp.]MDD3707294.1 Na+/H+ antiporter subunit E [Aminobacterium sp.]MDD4228540.1 Na+/H+ antiporter subunit E [Aminobacterium sp.]MDD4551484.1 Na+/H+ antiporter subunit E [Aminobacterium sp.]